MTPSAHDHGPTEAPGLARAPVWHVTGGRQDAVVPLRGPQTGSRRIRDSAWGCGRTRPSLHSGVACSRVREANARWRRPRSRHHCRISLDPRKEDECSAYSWVSARFGGESAARLQLRRWPAWPALIAIERSRSPGHAARTPQPCGIPRRQRLATAPLDARCAAPLRRTSASMAAPATCATSAAAVTGRNPPRRAKSAP